MEIEEKPSANEETYRVYNYFKERPGILLSAVSVLTAVLAVVANALAFLYQYIKLQKWNINILKWGLPVEGTAIYYPVLSLIYILLVLGLCSILLNIFEVYFSFSALRVYLRYIYLNDETESFPGSKKLLTKEEAQKQRKEWITSVFFDSLLALVVYSILVFVLLLHTGNLFPVSPSFFLACLLLLIIFLLFARTLAKSDVKTFYPSRKFRKALRHSKKKSARHPQSDLTEETFTQCTLNCNSLLTRKKEKLPLSDKNIFRYMIFIFIVFIAEFAIVCFTTITTTETNFWIYTDSQSSYVVAYRHDSQYILTEAQIDDSTITIDLSSQRVLQSDDLTMQQRQFNDVIWEKGDQP